MSPERAKELVAEIVAKGGHFVCHKASMQGEDICCKRFFDEIGQRIDKIQIFTRLNIITYVDQPPDDGRKFYSWKEQNGLK